MVASTLVALLRSKESYDHDLALSSHVDRQILDDTIRLFRNTHDASGFSSQELQSAFECMPLRERLDLHKTLNQLQRSPELLRRQEFKDLKRRYMPRGVNRHAFASVVFGFSRNTVDFLLDKEPMDDDRRHMGNDSVLSNAGRPSHCTMKSDERDYGHDKIRRERPAEKERRRRHQRKRKHRLQEKQHDGVPAAGNRAISNTQSTDTKEVGACVKSTDSELGSIKPSLKPKTLKKALRRQRRLEDQAKRAKESSEKASEDKNDDSGPLPSLFEPSDERRHADGLSTPPLSLASFSGEHEARQVDDQKAAVADAVETRDCTHHKAVDRNDSSHMRTPGPSLSPIIQSTKRQATHSLAGIIADSDDDSASSLVLSQGPSHQAQEIDCGPAQYENVKDICKGGDEDSTSRSNPTTPKKRKAATKSPYFSPSPTKRTRKVPVSCIPYPPLDAKSFGIVQELLAGNPFQLLIAVNFLNRTKGVHALPIFWKLMERYPTSEALAAITTEDILDDIKHLGLQRIRAAKIIGIANMWLSDPPQQGKRHRTLHYPTPSAGKDIKPGEMLDDDDERTGAWEIAHLPGVGAYALDSWRIFCRDVLRCKANDWKGTGAPEGFEPEWKRVVPMDKELRAFLKWMWAREGIVWDWRTGKRRQAEPGEISVYAHCGIDEE